MKTFRSEELLAAVESVCRRLGDSGAHPAHASSLDVARVLGCGVAEVEDAAVGLAAKGLLRIGRTLNYDYYEIMRLIMNDKDYGKIQRIEGRDTPQGA